MITTALIPYSKIVHKFEKPASECHLKKLPKDILCCICTLLPTNQIVQLTRTCTAFRADEKLLQLVCKRLGINSEQSKTWGIVSKQLETGLHANIIYRLAAKNLLEIPNKIITRTVIEELNQTYKSVTQSIPSFVFDCGLTRDGIIVPFMTPHSIKAQIKLVKSIISNNPVRQCWTYKLTIEGLDLSRHLSEQGIKIVGATTTFFNSIFAINFLDNTEKHKSRYAFWCNAELPYSFFQEKDYPNWLIVEMQARLCKKHSNTSKTCLIL